MGHSYTATFLKHIKSLLQQGRLAGFALMLVTLGLPLGNDAQAQCTIEIENINVNCNYAQGSSTFSASFDLTWSGVAADSVTVMLGGQAQTYPLPVPSGSQTITGLSLPAPGFGYTLAVMAGTGCQVFAQVDAIACTPPCPEEADAIGGFVWKDDNYNGMIDGEAGLANVKIEAYDCNGELAGTTFSNTDGQWSIPGLQDAAEYRVEFTAPTGMATSFLNDQNGSDVQFVETGNCGITAGFTAQVLEEECGNPDNVGNQCVENFNTLSWSEYADGAIPFPFPPYGKNVNGDMVYWSRTINDATDYTHRVMHEVLGGEDAYYYLEMDAESTDNDASKDVGVVFAFDRPVQRLNFELLDIDISGNALDRVSVKGYLGGKPVDLNMDDVIVGSRVNVIGNGVFEGTQTVADASTHGNVRILFEEVVDQVSISYTAAGSAANDPDMQAIGIGDISWCDKAAAIAPQCARIMDWMHFSDNDEGPMPYIMDGMTVSMDKMDPEGVAISSAFKVDNDQTPLGGLRGFWPLGMDATANGQFVQTSLNFDAPVEDVRFSILGIDQQSAAYHDKVSVHAFLDGQEVPILLGDLDVAAGLMDGLVTLMNANEYEAEDYMINGASVDGNVHIAIPGKIDSLVVRLETGSDSPADPAAQIIGLSDLQFCICRPAPIQIGDYAWIDEDRDGVQDACESPLAGLPVKLYSEGGLLMAITETDVNGQYHFTNAQTAGEEWMMPTQLMPQTLYYIVFGEGGNAFGNGFITVDGEGYRMTAASTGEGSNAYMNDSDAEELTENMPGDMPDGLPYIAYTTGAAGWTNQSLDVGFQSLNFDLALTAELDTALTAPPFLPGELVTYTVKVFNEGLIDATNVRFTNYLPDALQLVDGGDYHQTATLYRIPQLPAGDSAVTSITYRVKQTFAGGPVVNAYEITQSNNAINYTDIDSNGDFINGNDAADEDDYAAVEITVDEALIFDLALEKTVVGQGPFQPGDAVAFEITVHNEGILEGTDIQVMDRVPAGLVLADDNWEMQSGNAVLVEPIESLATDESVTLTINFTIAEGYNGGTIVNEAEIMSFYNFPWTDDQDSSPENGNEAEDDQDNALLVIENVFDLSLEKTVFSSGPYSPGSTVTYSLTVTNEGSVTAYDIYLADKVPNGLQLLGTTWEMESNYATLLNPISELTPGASATVDITFQIVPDFLGVSIANTAEIISFENEPELDDVDSTPANGSTTEDDDSRANISVQQVQQIYDLSLTKEVNTQLTPGPYFHEQIVTFDITVTNEGNVTAYNVQVADHIPAGLELVDPDWMPFSNMAVMPNGIPSLEPGESVTLTIDFNISPTAPIGQIENYAEIYADFPGNGLSDVDSTPGNGINNGEDDEDVAYLQVSGEVSIFDLALEKRLKTSITPGPFAPGDAVTFELEVTNEGTVEATNIQIADLIPAGLELDDADWVAFNNNGNIVILDQAIPSLAAGASTTVDISFVIKSDFAGNTINNRAEIGAASNPLQLPDEDSTPANGLTAEDDFDNESIQVQQAFDLALDKTVLTLPPYEAGQYVTYELTVYNQGMITAHDVEVFDYYPTQQLQLADADWAPVAGNILELASPIAEIAPGASVTVPITFQIKQVPCGSTITNCAEIGGAANPQQDGDSTPADGSHDQDDDDAIDIHTSCTQEFDLALTKTVTGGSNFSPGSTVTFAIEVFNQGDVTAHNIVVQDYFPQGLLLIDPNWSPGSGLATLNTPIASLAPGASTTVSVTFAISPAFSGSSLTNYAEIKSASNPSGLADVDSTPGNSSAGPDEDDYDGAVVHVVQQVFDLALSKSLKTSVTPGPFVPGSDVVFQIDIINQGNVTAQNIQLREYFPAGLQLTDNDWMAVGNVAELLTPIVSLAPGASTSVDVSFKISDTFTGTSLTNYAEIGSAFNQPGLQDTDSTPGNGSFGSHEDDYDGTTFSVLQQSFDLALSKSVATNVTPGPFAPGDQVTYQISVMNQGDLPATSIELRDYLPLGLSLNDPNWTSNGSTIVLNDDITNLQPGETVSVQITFTIDPDYTAAQIINFAEIGVATNSLGAADEDSTPGNGSAGANEDDYDGAQISIVTPQSFDLALDKAVNSSVTPGPYFPGSTVTYTITVLNEGTVTAQNIQLHDYVPLGLILDDPDWVGGGSTATLANPIASLAPGASASRDITFVVSPDFPGGNILNGAEVGAASNSPGLPDEDSTPGNGSAANGEDDFDMVTITVVDAEDDDVLDLALHKNISFSGPYQPGDLVTFEITVTNEGNVPVQNVVVRDYLPNGLILGDMNWSQSGMTAILNDPIDNLAPGATETVYIDLVISPDFTGTSITNFAEIKSFSSSSGLGDIDSAPDNGFLGSLEDDIDDASITISQQKFDLALTKSVSTAGPFVPGSPVTFLITVFNQGTMAAQYIELQDFIPDGLVLVDNDWTQNGNIATLNNPISSLSAGQMTSVSIDFVVDPTFTGTEIINNAEIAAAINPIGLGDTDSSPGNGAAGAHEDDYDGAQLFISQESDPAFDLALTKVVNTSTTPGPYALGDAVTFTITVINQGDFDAYNVDIVDYIPNGLSLNDGNWTQTASNARRTIPGPIPAAGGSAAVDISFTIDSDYMGSAITNVAEISFADDDQDSSNTPPVDVDSYYDSVSSNDAGGAPNTASDNAVLGNGTGSPGSTLAITDEDDHDPAMIVLNNCDNLSAGEDGYMRYCLSCNPTTLEVDLFTGLEGDPSPGGAWDNMNDNSEDNMSSPVIDIAGLDPGIYEYEYTVGGMGPCDAITSTVTIEIVDIAGYACNDQVNLTFGLGCEVEVTPDMILEGSESCMEDLSVNLYGPGGDPLGSSVTGDQIGQYIIAEVMSPYCGQVCWGTVYVNDVTSPAVVCPQQTVEFVCNDIDSVLNNSLSLDFTGEPTIIDNCAEYASYTFLDELANTADCEGQQINRVFTVTDPAGNTTQCTQAITIRDANFDDLVLPEAAPTIPCDSNFPMDAEGYPLPEVTGFPAIEGFYGTYTLDQSVCNLGATYEDTPFIEVCEGTDKFVRNWTIIDWCAGAGENVLTYSQVIKIGDVEGPQLDLPNADADGDGEWDPLVFSTSPFDCTGAFSVPMPTVSDNCSSFEVSIDVLVTEEVPQYNQFGQYIGMDTIQTVFTTIGPGESNFITGVPVGCHTFRYKVTDDCNNFTIAEAPFCVEDQIEPTAVCDDDLNISLGGQGFARVYAEDFDEGSNDNCALDTILVRRLIDLDPTDCSDVPDYNSDWAGFVDFTCCDVNQMVTIELLVIDESGNQNICWLEVLIEDKITPYCFAPADVNTTCADVPLGFDPFDTAGLDALYGAATADDNCSATTIQELPPVVNLNDCGVGTIIRQFAAFDAQGNASTNTCQQVVTIANEFNYTIKFPKDVISDCAVPDPDSIEIEGLGCDDLSVSVTEEIFYPTSGDSPECYTIFRKYRVLNHCEYNGQDSAVIVGRNEDCDMQPGDEDVWVVRTPGTVFIDRDNNPNNQVPAFGTKSTNCDGNTNPAGYWRTVNSVGLWEYTQIIKVMDSTPPQISFTEPDQFCSIDQTACNATVQYPFTIVENCSPDDLQITVELDAKADGTIDFDVTPLVSGTYPNYTIGGEYPIGSHEFVVTVQDGCGNNTNVATLPFDVVDCAAPTFTCLNGLTFNLQELPPNTDIDGDGEFDVAGAGIWANDFHLSVADCSDDTIAFSINLVGEEPDMDQTAIYFTCDDVGLVEVEVYFYDSAFNPEAVQPDGTVGGPNWDFCETYLYITDNNSLCSSPMPMMAGQIMRENDDAVEAVEVSLSGMMSTSMMTGTGGTYAFDSLPMGADYTVTPFRDDEHRNGVSTFDLIIIQQHLLGVTPLQGPYKRIAADVNRSGSITTLDMIQIQQLILGQILEFPNNTSWRFVAEDYVFPYPENPWFTYFPEAITVNNLDANEMAADFVAIKIGDVNNTATTTAAQSGQLEDRNYANAFYLDAEEQELQPGTLIEVPFYMDAEEAVQGYQFTLDFDPALLQLEDVTYGLADENSLGLYAAGKGQLTASWYETTAVQPRNQEGKQELFRLSFRVSPIALPGQLLSEQLRISSERTVAEAYSWEGEHMNVRLRFQKTEVASGTFQLYQNRPNPVRGQTVIGFELPESGTAEISLFDLNGRLLRVIEGDYAKGYNEVSLQRYELSELPLRNGVLYYRLRMGDRVATKKMIIME